MDGLVLVVRASTTEKFYNVICLVDSDLYGAQVGSTWAGVGYGM